MKKLLCIILAVFILFVMTGCVKTKTLHCDSCNKEVVAMENSDMNEDWIIYCSACNEELFGDDPVLGSKPN